MSLGRIEETRLVQRVRLYRVLEGGGEEEVL